MSIDAEGAQHRQLRLRRRAGDDSIEEDITGGTFYGHEGDDGVIANNGGTIGLAPEP